MPGRHVVALIASAASALLASCATGPGEAAQPAAGSACPPYLVRMVLEPDGTLAARPVIVDRATGEPLSAAAKAACPEIEKIEQLEAREAPPP